MSTNTASAAHERQPTQDEVAAFWNHTPCGSENSARAHDSRGYFDEIAAHRYRVEPHILEVLDSVDWRDRRVLEIGAGVGTDARQLIARGAIYTGVNVDRGSTELARRALATFHLPGCVRQCDATALPFADRSFDAVYTFGVLHHIPQASQAVREIRRVLVEGGVAVVMVYNRRSINYQIEIRVLRRLAARLLRWPWMATLLISLGLPAEKVHAHQQLAQRLPGMSDAEWLSRNTDGTGNPYSDVYDHLQLQGLLQGFAIERTAIRFFDRSHWGVLGRVLPAAVVRALGRRWGWHRVVWARRLPDNEA